MKKDFRTIKNIILLIASALTLVAVTFAWYSLSKKVGNFVINSNVSGSTLTVDYYESTDEGKTYSKLDGDLTMTNMVEGKKACYRMDVKTFDDMLVKLIMSFDGLDSQNAAANYVYFDYKVVCKDTGEVIDSNTGLKMSDYASNNVFIVDASKYQKNKHNNFEVYYDVYVVSNGEAMVSGPSSLGEVKLLGQQVN